RQASPLRSPTPLHPPTRELRPHSSPPAFASQDRPQSCRRFRSRLPGLPATKENRMAPVRSALQQSSPSATSVLPLRPRRESALYLPSTHKSHRRQKPARKSRTQ